MRKFKFRDFKKIFQITSIIEFEIPSKKKKIEISQVVKFFLIDQLCNSSSSVRKKKVHKYKRIDSY